MDDTRYYQKGFGTRAEILPILEQDYRSGLIDWLQTHGRRLEYGTTAIVIAREFGFCYGVDRAVEYAYETRDRFPDRRIFITGEIIHNPLVNRRLQEMEILRIPPAEGMRDRLSGLTTEDVVLIPAFGIEQGELSRLRELGVILVDTTCGSVLNVWKSVARYAREGITSIIHGKVDHEETRATCSQVLTRGGRYLVVRNLAEGGRVRDYIAGQGGRDRFLEEFAGAYSPDFDPDRDLARIGLANQTTMLSSESLAISELLRQAILARYGENDLKTRFASFQTICSATQDRQDAVEEMLQKRLDLMIVIGGYNSSNTTHLVEIARGEIPAFHIEGADDILSARWIRHKPLHDPDPIVEGGWLPSGSAVIGVTAGASTPNSEIGRTIEKLLLLRGVPDSFLAEMLAAGM
jgi:4-hydroxy-3-methylbut-2-en-1-yl diphosphate reductase